MLKNKIDNLNTRQMKTYKFNVSNPWLVFPTLIFSTFSGVKLDLYIQDLGIFADNKVIFGILSMILLVFFTIFMVWLIASAEMEVTLDDDIVSIKWIRQFLFNKKQDMKLPFNEMAAYVTRGDIHWNFLTINMSNGFEYKFKHLSFISNNFSIFVKAFVSAVDNYNKKVRESSQKSDLRVKPKTIEREYKFF